jgi:hypothetical protein
MWHFKTSHYGGTIDETFKIRHYPRPVIYTWVGPHLQSRDGESMGSGNSS